MEEDLKIFIQSGISQQPLIGYSSNLKLKLRGPNQNHKCLKGRQPSMEDQLKTNGRPQDIKN